MKEEILGGLRNALERGETIEKAMQTFISAGYSASEVRDAAGMINPSAAGVLFGNPNPASSAVSLQAPVSYSPASIQPALDKQTAPSTTPQSKSEAPPNSSQSLPASPTTSSRVVLPMSVASMQASQAKGKKTAIILAIVLIILVLILGATLLFSDKMYSLFSS